MDNKYFIKSFNIAIELYEKLTILAKLDKRSISKTLEIILENYFKNIEGE